MFWIYKIESLLHFTNKVLFAPTSYAKMFCSDERLIQFCLYLVIPINFEIYMKNLYIGYINVEIRLFRFFYEEIFTNGNHSTLHCVQVHCLKNLHELFLHAIFY